MGGRDAIFMCGGVHGSWWGISAMYETVNIRAFRLNLSEVMCLLYT
jgi:hypothetical protein